MMSALFFRPLTLVAPGTKGLDGPKEGPAGGRGRGRQRCPRVGRSRSPGGAMREGAPSVREVGDPLT